MTDPAAKPHTDAWRADAVRYRILRRLVPSVNHKLAGSMQPMTMLAGIFARQLQRPQPDIPALSKQVADMQQVCKAAITTRTEAMTWFHPSETEWVSMTSEAAQCMRLLNAEFAIRGCSLDNQMADAQHVVLQTCLRTMVMATLFAILDNAEGPVAVELRSLPASSTGATLVASWSPLTASDISRYSNSGHTIGWDDVQAVADQLGVGLQRTSAQIDMLFTLAA
jgi:hypothetical protein